jgi:hypothetical protein
VEIYDLIFRVLGSFFWLSVGLWLGAIISHNKTLMLIAIGLEWFFIILRFIVLILQHRSVKNGY